MSEPNRQIAIVRSYAELKAVLRRRAEELALTREVIDEISGLQSGYAGKLLAPTQVKAIGPESLGPLLSTLGLQIVVVEAPEAVKKLYHR